MYKEVAFDPRCMSEIEYYNLLKQHFGFEKGRYISADRKSWAREAMCHVKASSLKDVRKKSVTNYLNKLVMSKRSNEFHITNDRKTIHKDIWEDWFNEQLMIRRFSCTITENNACDAHINIDQVNDNHESWCVPASMSIPRTADDIITTLYPLIILSENITIIDQYFRLIGNAVLVKLFNEIRATSVRSLRVVTSMDTPNIEDVYTHNYLALNDSNVRFEWVKAPVTFFHDRYVISEVGALRSGVGFMAGSERGAHADLANINIISQDEASRTLEELERILRDETAKVELSI